MECSPERLQQSMSSGDPVLLVDVRSRFEFAAGHIPGAVHLPFWKAPFVIQALSRDRSRRIVLYCEHGPRAVLAKLTLSLSSYRNVSCLAGHMHRWRRSGRRLVRPEDPGN